MTKIELEKYLDRAKKGHNISIKNEENRIEDITLHSNRVMSEVDPYHIVVITINGRRIFKDTVPIKEGMTFEFCETLLTERLVYTLISGGLYKIWQMHLSELISDHFQMNWICTDPDCNQYMKRFSTDKFLFKEDRIVEPDTGKTEVFEMEIDLAKYSYDHMIEACGTFGYDASKVDAWLKEGKQLDLIAECIFELET